MFHTVTNDALPPVSCPLHLPLPPWAAPATKKSSFAHSIAACGAFEALLILSVLGY